MNRVAVHEILGVFLTLAATACDDAASDAIDAADCGDLADLQAACRATGGDFELRQLAQGESACGGELDVIEQSGAIRCAESGNGLCEVRCTGGTLTVATQGVTCSGQHLTMHGAEGAVLGEVECSGRTPTCDALRRGCSGPDVGAVVPIFPAGRAPFGIDATEVTVDAYARFVAAGGLTAEVASLPDFCEQPRFEGSCQPDLTPGSKSPVQCVTWCEASRYCAWAGKRLCGRLDGDESNVTELYDPTVGESAFVCSGGGEHRYPYGDDYVPGDCNVGDQDNCVAPACGPVSVASFTECQGDGPFRGVFDLIGNVAEWQAGCEAGSEGGWYCATRGGFATGFGGEQAQCARPPTEPMGDYMAFDTGTREIGLRCCSDF